jgi:Skp family chaperone for outer membrane proteins
MYERDWESEYYEAQRRHYDEMEQLRQKYRREIRDVCGYLEEALWNLEEWQKKAQKVAEAYRRSNGQLTDELKEAIEELIAHLPEPDDWL